MLMEEIFNQDLGMGMGIRRAIHSALSCFRLAIWEPRSKMGRMLSRSACFEHFIQMWQTARLCAPPPAASAATPAGLAAAASGFIKLDPCAAMRIIIG